MKNSLKSVLCVLVLLSCGVLHAQDGPTPYPDAKDDAAWPGTGSIRCFDWMNHNRASFWARRAQDQGAVVFVGDSLTAGWKLPGFAAAFPTLKVANRGIGGDVTRGLLFRFKEDVLDLNPRAIVLCIGTNDLSTHMEPPVIADNIALLLDEARARNPAMPVILCTIPPRAAPKAPLKRPGVVPELNTLIAHLAEGRKNVIVFDLHSALATPEGALRPGCFREDQIHLAAPGYEQWAARLTPVLSSLHL
ncbi:MAG TPA: GDSL-type esterase/lipase family protein [Rariglobus sp.]